MKGKSKKWPKELFYPGDVYSDTLITKSIRDGEFEHDKRAHFLFSVNSEQGRQFEFVSKKMQYTQREIITIHDHLEKSDQGKNKKIIEDVLLKQLPWRTYESIKNYWKTGQKNKLQT